MGTRAAYPTEFVRDPRSSDDLTKSNLGSTSANSYPALPRQRGDADLKSHWPHLEFLGNKHQNGLRQDTALIGETYHSAERCSNCGQGH